MTKTGTYTLVATSGNLGVTANSKSFTITAGPPVSLAFITQPANGQYVNSTLGATTGTVIVQMYDQFGNLANQPNVPITITITNTGTSTPYSTTTKPTNTLGPGRVQLRCLCVGHLRPHGHKLPVETASDLTQTPFVSVTSNTFIVTQAAQALVLTRKLAVSRFRPYMNRITRDRVARPMGGRA